MKKQILASLVFSLILVASAHAAPNSYQVTGPVIAMGADTITVKKGNDNWEIAKGSAAVPTGVKVGDKVTIQYTMTASTITAKDTAKKK